MNDDPSRQAATSPDQYTLTIDDAALRYEHAGHPRTPRTIQRSCAKGHRDCLRQETPFGEKYLITPEFGGASHRANRRTCERDVSRPVAPTVAAQEQAEKAIIPPLTGPDLPRQVAADNRYVGHLESENQFLRQQVTIKDEQIKDLTERSRETNHLFAGLQNMLSPSASERLQGASRPALTYTMRRIKMAQAEPEPTASDVVGNRETSRTSMANPAMTTDLGRELQRLAAVTNHLCDAVGAAHRLIDALQLTAHCDDVQSAVLLITSVDAHLAVIEQEVRALCRIANPGRHGSNT